MKEKSQTSKTRETGPHPLLASSVRTTVSFLQSADEMPFHDFEGI